MARISLVRWLCILNRYPSSFGLVLQPQYLNLVGQPAGVVMPECSPRCVHALFLDLPGCLQGTEFNLVIHVRPQGIEPCSRPLIRRHPTTSEIVRVRDLRIELSTSTL